MTVAVVVKVFDGIVLATDSATTLSLSDGSAQVWNSANKVFHLHRKRPIGAMTWGLGNIGSASIATLAKDLRRRLMGGDRALPEWTLPADYTVRWVADRLVDMIFDELYVPEFTGDDPPQPLGFLVAGFSCDGKHSEAWLVEIDDPTVRPAPQLVAGGTASGWAAYAQPEAATRLFTGFDPSLPQALAAVVPAEHMNAVQTVLRAGKAGGRPVDAVRRRHRVREVPCGCDGRVQQGATGARLGRWTRRGCGYHQA